MNNDLFSRLRFSAWVLLCSLYAQIGAISSHAEDSLGAQACAAAWDARNRSSGSSGEDANRVELSVLTTMWSESIGTAGGEEIWAKLPEPERKAAQEAMKAFILHPTESLRRLRGLPSLQRLLLAMRNAGRSMDRDLWDLAKGLLQDLKHLDAVSEVPGARDVVQKVAQKAVQTRLQPYAVKYGMEFVKKAGALTESSAVQGLRSAGIAGVRVLQGQMMRLLVRFGLRQGMRTASQGGLGLAANLLRSVVPIASPLFAKCAALFARATPYMIFADLTFTPSVAEASTPKEMLARDPSLALDPAFMEMKADGGSVQRLERAQLCGWVDRLIPEKQAAILAAAVLNPGEITEREALEAEYRLYGDLMCMEPLPPEAEPMSNPPESGSVLRGE